MEISPPLSASQPSTASEPSATARIPRASTFSSTRCRRAPHCWPLFLPLPSDVNPQKTSKCRVSWISVRRSSADTRQWIASRRCNHCAALRAAPPPWPFPPRCDREFVQHRPSHRPARCIRCWPAPRHTHGALYPRPYLATSLPAGQEEQRDLRCRSAPAPLHFRRCAALPSTAPIPLESTWAHVRVSS